MAPGLLGYVLVAVPAILLLIAKAIHRLYFHRLARFPGPRLAACTSLYRTYIEVVLGGELLKYLEKWHSIYGSVVRIGPNELHFNDHQAYSQIYAVGSKFTKDPDFYKSFGADNSSFGAINPQLSRGRRDKLNPFFSRRAILKLEDIIQQKVNKLVARLGASQKQANLFLAFRCTTMDIITSYCFANWVDSLDAALFHDPLLLAIQATVPLIWTIKAFPVVGSALAHLPQRFTPFLPARFQPYLELRRLISDRINSVTQDAEMCDQLENDTIYRHLLDEYARKDERDKRELLLDEGLSLLQAGSDTVGNTCTVGAFYILSDRSVRGKLVQELCEAWPEKDTTISLSKLERLPYLTAVIKESLRLSNGIVSPLPRVVGPSDTEIGGFLIPAGTVVGMGVTFLHGSPNLFTEPEKFNPERWLQPGSGALEQYLLPFSKGPRKCLGINMAWAELYMILGNVFRKLDMEIYGTSLDDFTSFKDYFIPVYQGKHLYATVRECF